MQWVQQLQDSLSQLVPKIDLSWLRGAYLRACPPNWHGLGDDVELLELFELTEPGLPTAWVPRAEVLHELVTSVRSRPAETCHLPPRASVKDLLGCASPARSWGR
jgi:hypothetical protein